MPTESFEFAGLWYVLALDVAAGSARWRDDDEAEEWLESIGAPDGYSMMLEPDHSWLLLASRRVVVLLSESLALLARLRPGDASDLREFAETIALDLPIMRDAPPHGEHEVVHPWSFGDGRLWQFWRLLPEQATLVAQAVRQDPQLSDPIVASYEEYIPLGGDLHSARTLLDALDAGSVDEDMWELRDSLSRWIARAQARENSEPNSA